MRGVRWRPLCNVPGLLYMITCSLGLLRLGTHVCTVSGGASGMLSRSEVRCRVRASNSKCLVLTDVCGEERDRFVMRRVVWDWRCFCLRYVVCCIE